MSDLNQSKDKKLIYEGSVKRLWQAPSNVDRLWFEFTDDYSIFDWGKMPDTVAHKGRALTFLGAYFFETMSSAEFWQNLPQSKHMKRFGGDWLTCRFNHPAYKRLVESGLGHHFLALTNGKEKVESHAIARDLKDKVYMEVAKADVPTPELRQIANHELYFYPHVSNKGKSYGRRLVPLEIVFRFGMPEGSSLTSRIQKNPDYLKTLGLPATPTPGEWFPQPVLEFFTKLEPEDRLLSWTEASLLSGLSATTFEAMVETTLYCSLALYHIFAERGLELWDGKFEFIVQEEEGKEAQILLADSIGPDELRLIYHGQHLSKELIRQIYKNTSWASALKKAKDLAKARMDACFKQICREELKETPLPLSTEEKKLVDSLYGSLANHVAGSEVFPNQPSLDQFVELLENTLGKDDKNSEWRTAADTRHPKRRPANQTTKTSIHQEKEISIRARGDEH